MRNHSVLLSITYFGPVQYYVQFSLFRQITIEKFETYKKQTYRNRCKILGANGPLNLIIPVKKTFGNRTKTKDIQIDYSESWQRIHWHSIISAYRSSPFFEFYEDEFATIYTASTKYLFDFNIKLMDIILTFLNIPISYKLTIDYEKNPDDILDLRNSIAPKKNQDELYAECGYNQVFSDKLDFVPNLSIIDLLFNEGPNALTVLKKIKKKRATERQLPGSSPNPKTTNHILM